jgi:hypothetical protein
MFLELLLFFMIIKNSKDIDRVNTRLNDVDTPCYENEDEKLEDLR